MHIFQTLMVDDEHWGVEISLLQLHFGVSERFCLIFFCDLDEPVELKLLGKCWKNILIFRSNAEYLVYFSANCFRYFKAFFDRQEDSSLFQRKKNEFLAKCQKLFVGNRGDKA